MQLNKPRKRQVLTYCNKSRYWFIRGNVILLRQNLERMNQL